MKTFVLTFFFVTAFPFLADAMHLSAGDFVVYELKARAYEEGINDRGDDNSPAILAASTFGLALGALLYGAYLITRKM